MLLWLTRGPSFGLVGPKGLGVPPEVFGWRGAVESFTTSPEPRSEDSARQWEGAHEQHISVVRARP